MKTFYSRDFRYMMTAGDIATANDGNYNSWPLKATLNIFFYLWVFVRSKIHHEDV